MSRIDWFNQQIHELENAGLYTTIRVLGSPQGAWLTVDSSKVLNFCSNNYLGLANHPRLTAAAKNALDKYGAGPAAVRTIAGTMVLHEEFEKRIADFKKADAAITFQSGFCANIGTIPALVGKNDVIFSDELNHASIIDGCRLSGARIVRYHHCDPAHLNQVIVENKGQYEKALVITDGVFSMDGDIAPLDRIFEITEANDLLLMVDDAHGEGVLGNGGRGIVDHFNLHGKVDIEIGTFSKAFGVVGGVAAGKSPIIKWLKQRSRPFLFSSAMTPPDVAACIEAINILEESTELVDRLWKNTEYFKTRVSKAGFNTGHSETPITPILLGEAELAQSFSKQLFDNGVFATAISYPTVPKGKARIRVMVSAAHSIEDLDNGLSIFTETGKKMGVIR
jgi:glycine C-acetyltransferase